MVHICSLIIQKIREGGLEFKVSLDYIVRSSQNNQKVELDFLNLMSRSLPTEILFICLETKNYDYGTLTS